MYLTQKFAKFIAETDYDVLPDQVVRTAKERIMDTIGAALAGSVSWEYAQELRAVCRQIGSGSAKAIGFSDPCFSPAYAAMISAIYAHSVELDDGHKNAGCHAGAVVVPSALIMGHALGRSGKEIIAAVVIGYEVTYRIASHVNPEQINRGFHPSSNCGVFGAMAAAGKLLELSEEQLANGLGQAGMLTCGTMEATKSGQRAKCVQVGNAARNGILSAYLAQTGMEGCLSALEGPSGFFATQSGRMDVEDICRGLGQDYTIGDTYSKLYPSCRHAQPGIEAALELGVQYQIDPDAVDSIWIGTHEVAYDLTGTIKRPQNSGEAKFSLAYGSAVALREHAFGIGSLLEASRTDPETLRLADKVVCEIDPAVQALYPKKRGARVRIALKNGVVYERELYDLKGSPGNPVSQEELNRKFLANAGAVIPEAQARQVLALCSTLEEQPEIGVLMDLLHQNCSKTACTN